MIIKGITVGLIVLLMPIIAFAAEVRMTNVIKLGINFEVSGLPDIYEERIIGMEPLNMIGLHLNHRKDRQLWVQTPWGTIGAKYHFDKKKHQITANVNAEEGAAPRAELYVDGVKIPVFREPGVEIGTPKDIVGEWVNGTFVNMNKISICENCTFTAEQIKQFNR